MTKRRKRIIFWAVIALVLAVIGLRVYYVACLRGPKIIKKWVQPDKVHYDDTDPLTIAIVQEGYEFKWPFLRPHYSVIIGPSDNLFGFDSLRFRNSALDSEIRRKGVDDWSVTWTDKGPHLNVFDIPAMHSSEKSPMGKSEKKPDDSTSTESDPSSTTTTTEEHR